MLYNRRILTFLKSAECGSITKAAEQLHLSTNAAWKQISNLEEEIGVTLFRKTTHGVILTEEGEYLYQQGQKILTICDEVIRNLHNKKKIRIMSYYLDGSGRLIHLIDRYQKKHIDADIRLVPYYDPMVRVPDVDTIMQETDVLVSLELNDYDHGKYEFISLGSVGFQCVVPKDHTLSMKSMIRLNDLKNQTVRVIEEGICIGVDSLVQEIKDICKLVRVPRKITDYYEIQYCIHIIPQRNGAVSETNRYIPLDTNQYVEVGVFIRKNTDQMISECVEYLYNNLGGY